MREVEGCPHPASNEAGQVQLGNGTRSDGQQDSLVSEPLDQAERCGANPPNRLFVRGGRYIRSLPASFLTPYQRRMKRKGWSPPPLGRLAAMSRACVGCQTNNRTEPAHEENAPLWKVEVHPEEASKQRSPAQHQRNHTNA